MTSTASARALVVFGLLIAADVSAQRSYGPNRQRNDDDMGQERPTSDASDSSRLKLRLNVGEQKVLSAEGVRSFSEGTRGIVEIRLTKDNERFVIVGTRAGQTTVLLIMQDGGVVQYDVTVEDPNAPVKQAVLTGIQPRDNIRLDFYFVQILDTQNYSVGIGWPASITGDAKLGLAFDLQTRTATSATASLSASAFPKLDLAQANGWAKIMRKAAVITANEAPATVSGGGEINIPLSGGFGGSLKQISYGTQVTVRPRYDKTTRRIELQVTADVSDLTPDSGSGAPGRTTSTLETLVNLEMGQSLVLAGLRSENANKGRSGLIGLSQIPILGALFGTHTSTETQSEIAIFIVPTVLDTVGMQERNLVGEALRIYSKYAGDMPHTAPLYPEAAPRNSR